MCFEDNKSNKHKESDLGNVYFLIVNTGNMFGVFQFPKEKVKLQSGLIKANRNNKGDEDCETLNNINTLRVSGKSH